MNNDADDMKISVLSSGSGGNVTYIETNQHKILLDAGLSGVRIERLMASINRSMKDVDMMLVTHEHTDHSKAVGVLARRYPQISVYANQPTWDAMADTIGEVPLAQKNIFPPNMAMSFGDIDIESFAVSHDAAQAQFYNFHHRNKSFVVLTDVGYISDYIYGTIKNANTYLLECNHDVEMLRSGDYPWSLKQRILGDEGHLSNEDGANTLMEAIGNSTDRIFIGHRSHHNNIKELAHLTVASMLEENDFGVGTDFDLLDTDVEKSSDLFTL
ncbi:MAG: MBL fold metallo-hydrolase [Apilactobacillus sp.]|uniref:MBL fold metallo-hydrolase n=1 Tax=Apilactobacillus TaxID=2767877 RepID=UPI0025F51532|nr:MBL fold metallo-hydrolase [Apilactobacillus sp.]MCT6823261.1 MBL fold metallo-hydrolase [Apilactobacillus sp.]MCT6858575.1 MBL fold metallo-hydrolase [Apilactobacillus sp.]